MPSPGRSIGKKTWLAPALVIGVVGAGVLGVAGLLAGAGEDPKSTAKGGVKGVASDRAVARVMSFEVTTTCNGELESRNKIEVRNPLEQDSSIMDIAPEGVQVKKGDLLVRLNTDKLQQSIDDETLRLQSADADKIAAETGYDIQLNENESNTRQAALKVELARLALRQWAEGDAKKKRQELALAIDTAALELERLAEKYTTSQELLGEGFISKDECDRDEVSYIEAISKYETAFLAKEVYENYEFQKDQKTKQSDVDEAQAELGRVELNNRSQAASKLAKRDNQRRQVEVIANRLQKLKTQRDAATVLAPSDGLVVYASSFERNNWGSRDGPFQIGQQVAPNQLLIILPDTSEMVGAIRVTESLAGRVRQGQHATVRVDAAAGATFDGTVESIGVMAETGGWRDPNLREYTVRVSLVNKSGVPLKPAMRCEARIVLDQVSDALAVPVQAVFSEGPVQYVNVESPPGRFTRRPVKIGRRSETLAEIRAGLSPDEVVLLRQPTAAESSNASWAPEQLKAAGYIISENGSIVPEGRPEGGQRPGGNKGGSGRRGGSQGAGSPTDAKPAPATPGDKG